MEKNQPEMNHIPKTKSEHLNPPDENIVSPIDIPVLEQYVEDDQSRRTSNPLTSEKHRQSRPPQSAQNNNPNPPKGFHVRNAFINKMNDIRRKTLPRDRSQVQRNSLPPQQSGNHNLNTRQVPGQNNIPANSQQQSGNHNLNTRQVPGQNNIPTNSQQQPGNHNLNMRQVPGQNNIPTNSQQQSGNHNLNTQQMPGQNPPSQEQIQIPPIPAPAHPKSKSTTSHPRKKTFRKEQNQTTPAPGSFRRISANNPKAGKTALSGEFHRRLRGKPTHAAPSRTWYRAVSAAVFAVVKIFVIILLMIGFLVGGFGGGLLAGYVVNSKEVSDEVKALTMLSGEEEVQTSFIYDIYENQEYKLIGSENIDRVYVPFGIVSKTYIDEAIIAIEDERYHSHNGIDIRRIGSAVLSMLANSGTATHGGSTITQQTVKLITGLDTVSTQRKVQEWFAAMDLEEMLSKDQILDLYVNLAPMGNNYVGVQAAAKNYFGKDAKDLTLAECALLAGIPKSPSYYNPSTETGRRNALRRMRTVLQKMHELGFITDIQFQDALNTELNFRTETAREVGSTRPYYIDYAIQEVISDLAKKYNYSSDIAETLVFNRGYKIYLTIEPEVQAIVDEAYNTQSLFQQNPGAVANRPEKPESGIVIINNETGAIAAMYGGYGEKKADMVFNRATDLDRQPGSSFKPLAAYAPALDMKVISPGTSISSTPAPLNPATKENWPKARDNGPMSISSAITSSHNVVAVRVWGLVGGDNVLHYLKQVGIDMTNTGIGGIPENYPSIALGGGGGVSPLQMAAAYATFPSGGVYREPFSYSHVTDSEGNILLDNRGSAASKNQAYSPVTAYLMCDMMKNVITSGTASGTVHRINGGEIDVAGKTGTTELAGDYDVKDKWFCGFTPYYSAAVWYGYDNAFGRQTNIDKFDDPNAMRIWDFVMQKVHEGLEPAKFVRPENVEEITICSVSNKLATQYCHEAGAGMTDWIATDAPRPSEYCTDHLAPTPTPPPETEPEEPTPDLPPDADD